jgi:hypothetical protein
MEPGGLSIPAARLPCALSATRKCDTWLKHEITIQQCQRQSARLRSVGGGDFETRRMPLPEGGLKCDWAVPLSRGRLGAGWTKLIHGLQ